MLRMRCSPLAPGESLGLVPPASLAAEASRFLYAVIRGQAEGLLTFDPPHDDRVSPVCWEPDMLVSNLEQTPACYHSSSQNKGGTWI